MVCECGFKFAGPGEFRNCECYLSDGGWIYICPKCKKEYSKEIQ